MATTLGPQTSTLANRGFHAALVLLCVLHCSSLSICLSTASRGSGGSKERKMQSPQAQDTVVFTGPVGEVKTVKMRNQVTVSSVGR